MIGKHRVQALERRVAMIYADDIKAEKESAELLAATNRFFKAIASDQESRVGEALHAWCLENDSSKGGQGIGFWLRMLGLGHGFLPRKIPPMLIDTYLNHPDAILTGQDCEDCGLGLPVCERVLDQRTGETLREEHVFFPACPHCGGKAGPWAYQKKHGHAFKSGR